MNDKKKKVNEKRDLRLDMKRKADKWMRKAISRMILSSSFKRFEDGKR